jgi:hypothetical protein
VSKHNNWLIAKLINIFANVEARRKEGEESWAPMQAPSWTRKHRHPIEIYVRRNKKENEDI